MHDFTVCLSAEINICRVEVRVFQVLFLKILLLTCESVIWKHYLSKAPPWISVIWGICLVVASHFCTFNHIHQLLWLSVLSHKISDVLDGIWMPDACYLAPRRENNEPCKSIKQPIVHQNMLPPPTLQASRIYWYDRQRIFYSTNTAHAGTCKDKTVSCPRRSVSVPATGFLTEPEQPRRKHAACQHRRIVSLRSCIQHELGAYQATWPLSVTIVFSLWIEINPVPTPSVPTSWSKRIKRS